MLQSQASVTWKASNLAERGTFHTLRPLRLSLGGLGATCRQNSDHTC